MAWYEFKDRREAGRLLAALLGEYAKRSDTIVLALPRGGVPVGYEVATALQAPLDVLVVRKIGVPYHRELAMGAVASGGTYAVNRDVLEALRITSSEFLATMQEELEELRRRESAYRQGRPSPDLAGKVVILVDDGLATGSSMRVAIDAVRAQKPAKVVVAAPVAPIESREELDRVAAEMVCVYTPDPFIAVGAHYRDFGQVSDLEVGELLEKARTKAAA
jgi:putative phosphoribosyl transferase